MEDAGAEPAVIAAKEKVLGELQRQMTRAVERRPPNPTTATAKFLKDHGTGGTLAIATDMMQDALAGLESILSQALSRAVSDINAELRKGFKELRVSLA